MPLYGSNARVFKERPLSERVITTKDTEMLHCEPNRPKEYKCWNEENMSRAVAAVLKCGISVRKAALMYGIPKSTLGDRISGRVLAGSKSGPLRYLSEQEEEELISFIKGCAEIGYPKTVKDILALVQQVLASRGVDREVTYGWWEGFRKRHPDLSLRIPSTISKARALATDRASLDHYFDLLEETILENNLKDKPGQIYNLDETGMPLDPKSLKTIHSCGDKNPYTVSSGRKSQMSVLACVSASGQCIPPMVIWDRKKIKEELTVGEVPGTMNAMSPKGWMNRELFEKWFCKHFLCYALQARPLLLLMDGHSSHYSLEAIKMAAEEGVLLYTLPPNTTHLVQPLDKGVFGPLKMCWRRTCHNFMSHNPGQVVTQYNFARLFATTWFGAMTPKNIISGFRTTGIFPVDRDALTLPGEKRRSLAERTGLSYIPLFTPSKKIRQVHFSQEEVERYNFHFENGLHLEEARYHLWLQKYKANESITLENSSSDDDDDDEEAAYHMHRPLTAHSTVSHMFKVPSPPHRKVTFNEKKQCTHLLTSAENIKQMEEKENKKKGKGKRQCQSLKGSNGARGTSHN